MPLHTSCQDTGIANNYWVFVQASAEYLFILSWNVLTFICVNIERTENARKSDSTLLFHHQKIKYLYLFCSHCRHGHWDLQSQRWELKDYEHQYSIYLPIVGWILLISQPVIKVRGVWVELCFWIEWEYGLEWPAKLCWTSLTSRNSLDKKNISSMSGPARPSPNPIKVRLKSF